MKCFLGRHKESVGGCPIGSGEILSRHILRTALFYRYDYGILVDVTRGVALGFGVADGTGVAEGIGEAVAVGVDVEVGVTTAPLV